MTDLKTRKAAPDEINEGLDEISTATIKEKVSIHQLLKRPEISLTTLEQLDSSLKEYFQKFDTEVREQVEILTKYESYLEKERQHAERVESLEDYRIPVNFDYGTVKALSTEAREKLGKIRPQTIGQASRISGVSPADVSVIMIYLGK